MKYIYFCLLFFGFTITTHAQLLDSLQMQVGTTATVSSNGFLPLWLQANKFGVITDQQVDFSTHFKATSAYRLGRYSQIYDTVDRSVHFSYGIDIYNNDHLRKIVVPEAYIKATFRKVTLSVGRFKQIIGEIDHDLSSGSLGVSGNALPITKFAFSVDWTDIPFTNGFAQFKGHLGNGWMGHDQYMKKALLHEKSLYGRLGKGKLKAYAGIQHYAVWGGSRADSYGGASLDKNFKGFVNVLFGFEANDGSVPDSIRPNRPGDQRGVLEAGLEWENDAIRINLNNQTPFDQGLGIDVRNIDRLLSLNIVNKNEESWFKKFVAEFLHTKQMNDFTPEVFRDNYYNNGVYRTGWEYHGHIVGTPLYTNRVRGQNFLPNVKPYDWDAPGTQSMGLDNIIINRVVGGHMGVMYAINDKIGFKTMLTYLQNYGRYVETKNKLYKYQCSTLQEVNYAYRDNIKLTAGIAYDWGELYKNFGTMLSVQWQFRQ